MKIDKPVKQIIEEYKKRQEEYRLQRELDMVVMESSLTHPSECVSQRHIW